MTARLDSILSVLEVPPFETPAESTYGELRTQLEAAEAPVGGNDLLIAAHTLSLGCTIVTDNAQEFSRIGGVTLENWLQHD